LNIVSIDAAEAREIAAAGAYIPSETKRGDWTMMLGWPDFLRPRVGETVTSRARKFANIIIIIIIIITIIRAH